MKKRPTIVCRSRKKPNVPTLVENAVVYVAAKVEQPSKIASKDHSKIFYKTTTSNTELFDGSEDYSADELPYFDHAEESSDYTLEDETHKDTKRKSN